MIQDYKKGGVPLSTTSQNINDKASISKEDLKENENFREQQESIDKFWKNYMYNKDNKPNQNEGVYIGSSLFETISRAIYEHRPSNYFQINLKLLQNLSFLASLAGINLRSFYLVDLSPSGTGKDTCASTLKELMLPIINDQEDRARQFGKEKRKENESKEIVMGRCLHGEMTTLEALNSCFEFIPTQMVEITEIGMALKDGGKMISQLVKFATKNHAQRIIEFPTFKNRTDDLNRIEGSFYFYANTNISYLGKFKLLDELIGGSFNRPLLIYSKKPKNFEEAQWIGFRDDEFFMLQDMFKNFFEWCQIQKSFINLNEFSIIKDERWKYF